MLALSCVKMVIERWLIGLLRQSFMVVDAILERNPEVSFKSSIDMDRVSDIGVFWCLWLHCTFCYSCVLGFCAVCTYKAPVAVWTHCTNAWWNRCKTDLNSFPRRKLDETTGTSSYYMDENHSEGSEIQRPQYGRHSWPGAEPSTLEIDVYVRRYALLVVLARNDDDDIQVIGLTLTSMWMHP